MSAWFCLDCNYPQQLDRHGRCSACGSNAVTESEGRGRCFADKSISTKSPLRMEKLLSWRATTSAFGLMTMTHPRVTSSLKGERDKMMRLTFAKRQSPKS